VRWVWRFSTRNQRDELNRLINKTKFYHDLNIRLNHQVMMAQAELDALKKEVQPLYEEKPINEDLQTGESRLLGGEMRLKSAWAEKMED